MPTDRKPLIFISSTSDLQEERRAVAESLPRSIEAYRYEEDTARRASPRERLEGVLAKADVFVAILGGRYGSTHSEGGTERSIVEWEFETAWQRRQLEIFAFRKLGLQTDMIDRKQQAFIERLEHFEGGLWLKPFESVAQLKEHFGKALMDWLTRFYQRSLQRDAEGGAVDGRKPAVLLARNAILFALMAALGALAAAALAGWLPTSAVVALSLLLAVVIGACMTLIDQ